MELNYFLADNGIKYKKKWIIPLTRSFNDAKILIIRTQIVNFEYAIYAFFEYAFFISN